MQFNQSQQPQQQQQQGSQPAQSAQSNSNNATPAAPANPEPEIYRNLMVNYIPTTVSDVQLRQLFEPYGTIESVKIVCDPTSRQSRGYGFVKYQTAASAQQAIQNLNGYSIQTKHLKVALAANGQQRNNNNRGGRGGYGYGGYNNAAPMGGGYAGPVGYGVHPYAQPQMVFPQQLMMPSQTGQGPQGSMGQTR